MRSAGEPDTLRMVDLGEAEPIDEAAAGLRRALDPWGRSQAVPDRAPRGRPVSPQAGAGTLVVSLWPVPDRETRNLMEDFYRRLLEGRTAADALRGAKLALREEHPDPRLWAAFVCVGVPAEGPVQPPG